MGVLTQVQLLSLNSFALISLMELVNVGEDLTTAATRETKEEAGIDVELTGILRWEWAPHKGLRKEG